MCTEYIQWESGGRDVEKESGERESESERWGWEGGKRGGRERGRKEKRESQREGERERERVNTRARDLYSTISSSTRVATSIVHCTKAFGFSRNS